jgi:CRP-like cAMP-binding protein
VPGITRSDKLRILSGTPLFSKLGDALVGQIADVARVQQLDKRKTLFHKGDAATHVYIVASGVLKVLSTSADADDVVFALQSAGDVIGEVALFTEGKRTATVRALEPSELLVIDRRDFVALVRRNPDIAVHLLELLAERLARLTRFVESTQFLTLPQRLAQQVTALATRYGHATPDGVRIELPLSQEEWGDLVGATREAVNKQLGEWRESGFLSLEGRQLTLHDLPALLRIAKSAGG